ncbi:MAG: hypothetical protein VXX85_05355 [Candidatus Margulisiibacteriota bacterium]|nr:hypothetical protein [Candidatus Margulisiibacteriota bacterium]
MTSALKGLGLTLTRSIHSQINNRTLNQSFRNFHSQKTIRELKNHLNNARRQLDCLDLQKGDQDTIQNNLKYLELIKHNINEIKWGLKRKEEQHASCNKSNAKLLEWSWDKRYMF